MNRVVSLRAPPGRMGLVLVFVEEGRGPIITGIDPKCPFKGNVNRGDRLLSIARHPVSKPEHLLYRMNEEREVNFIASTALPNQIAKEKVKDDGRSRRRLRIHIKLPSYSTTATKKMNGGSGSGQKSAKIMEMAKRQHEAKKCGKKRAWQTLKGTAAKKRKMQEKNASGSLCKLGGCKKRRQLDCNGYCRRHAKLASQLIAPPAISQKSKLKPVLEQGSAVYAAYWPPYDSNRETEPSWYPGVVTSYRSSCAADDDKRYGPVRSYCVRFDDGDQLDDIPDYEPGTHP